MGQGRLEGASQSAAVPTRHQHTSRAAKDRWTNRWQETLGPTSTSCRCAALPPHRASPRKFFFCFSVAWFALVWVARTEWAKVVARHKSGGHGGGANRKRAQAERGVRRPTRHRPVKKKTKPALRGRFPAQCCCCVPGAMPLAAAACLHASCWSGAGVATGSGCH